MIAEPRLRPWLPYAGLVLGPIGWACNTQLGEILPYSQCGSELPLTAMSSMVFVLLAIGAGLVSWTAAPLRGVARFVSALSGLSGLTFGYALALQAASGFILSGCER
jgi:hypothetical protein